MEIELSEPQTGATSLHRLHFVHFLARNTQKPGTDRKLARLTLVQEKLPPRDGEHFVSPVPFGIGQVRPNRMV